MVKLVNLNTQLFDCFYCKLLIRNKAHTQVKKHLEVKLYIKLQDNLYMSLWDQFNSQCCNQLERSLLEDD